MDKNTALEKLSLAYKKCETVKNSSAQSHDFLEWRNFSLAVIKTIYGEDSRYAHDFSAIKFDPGHVEYRVTPAHKIHAFAAGLTAARDMLGRLTKEMHAHGDEILRRPKQTISHVRHNDAPVLILHGKSFPVKNEFIELMATLKLKFHIISKTEDDPTSLLEQLEAINEISFAICIIMPDELDLSEDGQEVIKLHPSQQIVFGCGYLLGKFGKNKVCFLYRHGVELPFESGNVAQVQLDKEAWKFKLIKEMKTAGLPVDANQLI